MADNTDRPNLKRKLSLTSECVTNVPSTILKQKWTIRNFSSVLKLSQPADCLRSNVFKDGDVPEVCWQLCLYPGGKRWENANNVSLFLKMSAYNPSKDAIVKAEYSFFFLDDNEQPAFSNINVGEFHAKPPKGGHSWGLRNIPMRKVQDSIRHDDSLVILCVIEVMSNLSSAKPCKIVAVSPANDAKEEDSIPDTEPVSDTVDFQPSSPDGLPDDFRQITVRDTKSPEYDDEFDAELVD